MPQLGLHKDTLGNPSIIFKMKHRSSRVLRQKTTSNTALAKSDMHCSSKKYQAA